MTVKPLVGISCCTKQFGIFGMPNHAASDTYVRATDQVVGAVPVLIPANGERGRRRDPADRLDGIMLTGSRSNVHPSLYGGPPHAEGTPEDPVARRRHAAADPRRHRAGVPLLAICRGLQELNVALGGTLHQRLQDLPDRIDHSTPDAARRTRMRHRQGARDAPHAGELAAPAGRRDRDRASTRCTTRASTSWRQAWWPRASAPDGTIEAVRVAARRRASRSACSGTRNTTGDRPVSRRIFEAFGDAVAERQGTARRRSGLTARSRPGVRWRGREAPPRPGRSPSQDAPSPP